MNKKQLRLLALGGCLVAASLALAQTGEQEVTRHVELQRDTDESLFNRVRFAYRLGLNITARFKNLGGFQAQSNPGPATGTKQRHTYDDGYFLPDSRLGNIDPYTWNWGFSSASQVQAGNGTSFGSLLLHSSSAPETASTSSDDPQHGFEVSFERHIGKLGRARWGLGAAFNFTDLSVRNNNTLSADSTRLTDTYNLDGLNPFTGENTPYQGSFYGPGPLPVDSPASRQIQQSAGGSMITGNRTLDASLYGVRFGPYLELPLGKRFAASLSGGLSLVAVDSDFSYAESVSITGLNGSQSHSGRSSRDDLLVGGHIGGSFSYALSRPLSTFASIQFQDVGKFSQSAGAKKAELDLSSTVFVLLGFSYSF